MSDEQNTETTEPPDSEPAGVPGGIFLSHTDAQLILDYITLHSTPAPQPGINGTVYMMIEALKHAPQGRPLENGEEGNDRQ